MKRFINKISTALMIVLLLQISLFGQTSMLKSVEAASLGPVIVSMSPANNLSGVPINSGISITFDQAVKIGTGLETIEIYENFKSTLFESFPVTSPNVVISGDGRTVSVRPSNPFENNTDYYVRIEPGYFANASNGASFSGITDPIVWNFKTIESRLSCALVIDNGAAYTNSTSVKLNVLVNSPNNDPIEMTFWEQNKPWSPLEPLSSTKDWTLSTGDGSKTVYMNASDASNVASCGGSIILDTTPPVVAGVIDGKAYNQNLTIAFNEGTATLNGAAFTSGTTVVQEGTYTLIVTDAASNATTVTFTIDKTAPIIQGVVDGETYNSDRTIAFNEGTATLNGTAFTSGSIVAQEGTYTLVVKDTAGNITTVNFIIDKTAPTGSISILNGATTTNTTSVTLNLTGTDDNPLKMQFSNDGSNWSPEEPFTSTKAWTLDSGYGTKTVYFKLTDSAGNSVQYNDTIILNAPLNTNADLKNISFSKGTLTPAFAPNILSYIMSVASQVSSIDVQPTAEFNKATMKVNGVDAISGDNKTTPLSYGANTITIEVTAEDGITKKTYTVTVNRARPSNPGTSSPEPVIPVPVQPENTTPVKAIPNTILPNPHGLPVATLTVNEDIKLYQLDDAGNLVEVKQAKKGSSLSVYDIYQGLYKLADNLYAIPSPSISIHIGKGEVRKDEVNVFDKDGRFLRTIKKGQEYKVYSYDDNRYAIGGGEFIEVQDGVTYVFGWITITEPMTLYKADGTIERILQVGEKYRIYSAHKDVLQLGGGFTVKRKNSMYTFVKN